MKTISYWARSHKAAARALLVLSYLLLNSIGWQMGVLLHDSGILFSETALTITVAIYLAGAVFYPAKRWKTVWGSNKYYIRQKTCDFLLISGTFAMIVYAGNRAESFPSSVAATAAVTSNSLAPGDSVKRHKSVAEFASAMKDSKGRLLQWKERKKILKQQVNEIKKAPAMTSAERTFLTILFVLLAIGLEMGVLALSCSLSCSGSEGAALLVGVGGTALIIFLLVVVIRSLHKKKTVATTSKAPA
ncbi:MAG TPA: hypothetical protein VGN63_16295 [Flavisolibacter sp.]|jgi:hypothetical protein|nr:hypothetical protein [Flavisolibacter sp.]